MALDAKGKSFADKVGRILANRYGDLIDAEMSGFLTSDDPDSFTNAAVDRLVEELGVVFGATVARAIEIRQGGE